MPRKASNVVRFTGKPEPMSISLAKLPSIIGVTPRSLRNIMADDKEFPRRFMIGRREFVLVSEFETWMTHRVERGPIECAARKAAAVG